MGAAALHKRVIALGLIGIAALAVVLGLALNWRSFTAAPVSPAIQAAIANEAAKIATTQGRVERRGETLLVHADGGKTITFKNENDCADKEFAHCVSYRFVNAYLNQDSFLVHATRRDGSPYTWINAKDGRTFDLCEQPRFSKEGGRFILVGAARETALCSNDIEIWDASGSEPRREFGYQYVDSSLCCRLKEWRDEEHVTLSAGIPDGQAVVDGLLYIDREDGVWHVKSSTDGGKTVVLLH